MPRSTRPSTAGAGKSRRHPHEQHTRTVFALDKLLSLSELQEQRRRKRPVRFGGRGFDDDSDEDEQGNKLEDAAARAAGALMSAFARKDNRRHGSDHPAVVVRQSRFRAVGEPQHHGDRRR